MQKDKFQGWVNIGFSLVGVAVIIWGLVRIHQEEMTIIANTILPDGLIFIIIGFVLIGISLRRTARLLPTLIVSMGALGIGLFVSYYLWGGVTLRMPPGMFKKYDVFRDLLSILLAIIGMVIVVVGGILYRLLSRGLQEQVKTGVEQETSVVLSHLFTQLSGVYTSEYEPDPTKTRKEQYKELAKKMSQTALAYAENLSEKDFENEICSAKNNLAYDLIVRKREQDGKLARELAEYIYKRAHKYGDNYRWLETYGLVLIYFGKNKKEKEKGKKIIKELFSRKDIPDSWIKRRQKIYKKCKLNI